MHANQLKKLDEQLAAETRYSTETINTFLADFKVLVSRLEDTHTRDEIIALIPNIRRIAAQSPFVDRAQRWPKGYQGDFETIAHLISGENKSEPGSIGYLIEDFFLASDICKQHIHKVIYQSALVAKAIATGGSSKIMSIGCGTSEDIRLNIPNVHTGVEFTIVDADMEAVKHSLKNLAPISQQVEYVHGNIYKIARTLPHKYNLILIGGVFDYLSDKTIKRVLAAIKTNLTPGGTLFFTNIKKDNPYRIYMEYLSDWILIERREEDIYRLLAESGLNDHEIKISLDDTGLTFLVEIKVR